MLLYIENKHFVRVMDSNPGVSLFQGADIQIDNAKNVEEEEDLEDQIRRKEEVQLFLLYLFINLVSI